MKTAKTRNNSGETKSDGRMHSDGSVSSKAFLSFVAFGVAVGILVIGMGLVTWITQLPHSNQTATRPESEVIVECDALIKSGELAKARAVLEKEEEKHGLTAQQSEKLDSIYVQLAQNAMTNGARTEAIELLKFIPVESTQYPLAQSTIKKLQVVPKAIKKGHTKSKLLAHTKHHR